MFAKDGSLGCCDTGVQTKTWQITAKLSPELNVMLQKLFEWLLLRIWNLKMPFFARILCYSYVHLFQRCQKHDSRISILTQAKTNLVLKFIQTFCAK